MPETSGRHPPHPFGARIRLRNNKSESQSKTKNKPKNKTRQTYRWTKKHNELIHKPRVSESANSRNSPPRKIRNTQTHPAIGISYHWGRGCADGVRDVPRTRATKYLRPTSPHTPWYGRGAMCFAFMAVRAASITLMPAGTIFKHLVIEPLVASSRSRAVPSCTAVKSL